MELPMAVRQLHESGIISDEQLSKLAEIRVGATAAICVSQDEFNKFAEETIESGEPWEDRTFCKVARFMDNIQEHVSLNSEELEKNGISAKNIQLALTGLAATGLAAIPTQRAISGLARNRDISNSWETIVENNPDAATDLSTAKYWSVLQDFAPDIAANPVAAESIVRTMKEYGTVTPGLIKDLISMQRGIDDSSPGFGGKTDPVKALSTLSDMYGHAI